MELAEPRYGIGICGGFGHATLESFPVVSLHLDFKAVFGDVIKTIGQFVALVDPEAERCHKLPNRLTLFLRMSRESVLELPRILVKQENRAARSEADVADYTLFPVVMEFQHIYPYSPVWHKWPASIAALAKQRMLDPDHLQNPKKCDVEELRKLLAASMADTDLPTPRFTTEGGLRR